MKMKLTPGLIKWGLNIYGPFVGAGIKMEEISQDWRSARVSMKLRWYNRNIMGGHFGGSLYAMVDPQLMVMVMECMGKEYRVWDQAARIEFVKPGKGKVTAHLTITDQDLDEIRTQTADGAKYLHTFPVDIFDEEQEVVARVEKVIYIRKKPSKN
ncbi:MAG: DUF4442 domain-containing protein [Desulfobacterales bacterium]|nr:DUF4442 domain-containing protein [Desulfobacterales bacterium]